MKTQHKFTSVVLARLEGILTFILFLTGYSFSQAQTAADKKAILQSIESKHQQYAVVAKKIWSYAELGFHEFKSTALLQQELKNAGFTVKAGVADMPTSFIAEYGSGKPVIGMLAEYDALPGLSQDTVAERKALKVGAPGHGCGHNLLGTGALAAAIAVKDWLKSSGTKGTIRLYGTPAEEGGSGKVYMVRAGLFEDVDAVVRWHPGDKNSAESGSNLAFISGKFRFHGIAAHASGAPERGRSALDGVEAMDNMVNMMREHVPSTTRIHYVITKGGEAPNVVPAFAEVFYYVRNPDRLTVKETWERVVKASEGAALGTGTTVDHEIISGMFNVLPNETLSKIVDKNLRITGGLDYTEKDKAYAMKIQESFTQKPSLEQSHEIQPFKTGTLGTCTYGVSEGSFGRSRHGIAYLAGGCRGRHGDWH